MAVASLVLGIVSIALNFIGLGFPIGTILGLVGIVPGLMARKSDPGNGLATGGMVCSIIGTILSVLFIVLCAACVGSIGGLGALASL